MNTISILEYYITTLNREIYKNINVDNYNAIGAQITNIIDDVVRFSLDPASENIFPDITNNDTYISVNQKENLEE